MSTLARVTLSNGDYLDIFDNGDVKLNGTHTIYKKNPCKHHAPALRHDSSIGFYVKTNDSGNPTCVMCGEKLTPKWELK